MAFQLHPGFKADYEYANMQLFQHVNGAVTSPVCVCTAENCTHSASPAGAVADSRNNSFIGIRSQSEIKL